MISASLIFNLAIVFFFVVAVCAFVRETRGKNKKVPPELKLASRYFTVQSNIFAAFVCLVFAVCDLLILSGGMADIPLVMVVLKAAATSGLMLTFLVVLCYLLPKFGMTDLFQGANFYMHLVTPLLCLISFLFFERIPVPIPCFLFAVLGVGLYAGYYAYRVIFTSDLAKKWDDMYLFNEGGKWKSIILIMLVVTAAISFIFGIIHNLLC